MKTTQLILLCAMTMVILFSYGCGGGKMILTAQNVNKPVSVTAGLYSQDYKLLNEGDYTVLNSFEISVTKWTIFYTLVDLQRDPDISDTLNAMINEHNGDAIVNFRIHTNSLTPIEYLGSILPIIPTRVSVDISGEIVKMRK